MGFFLLILVTAVMLIRPTDYVPGLESVQLYLLMILACLVTSATVIPKQLSVDSLKRRPITACVVAMFLAFALSNLVNLRVDAFVDHGIEFAKVVLVYLLLVGLVNSLSRLRCYVLSVAGILCVPIGLSVLHYYHYINLPAFDPVYTDSEGNSHLLEDGRMRGAGMFGDPNDLCLLINVGLMLSLYGVMNGRGKLVRFLWLAPTALFAEGLRATGSRGGLAAFLASIAVLFVSRFGIRKGLLIGAVALPVTLSLFGGRQVDFDLNSRENTGQLRIQLWSNALEVFKTSPIFGVGSHATQDRIQKAVHNSFIQAYADLGFIGGTILVAAFYHAYRRLFQLQRPSRLVADPELDSMRPFILAAMTGYGITMMSTNHPYNVVTYAILGIAAAAIHLADADQPPPGESLDGGMMVRLICVSIFFLVGFYVYVGIFCRY
jgi:O-antigen ligase